MTVMLEVVQPQVVVVATSVVWWWWWWCRDGGSACHGTGTHWGNHISNSQLRQIQTRKTTLGAETREQYFLLDYKRHFT